MADRDPLSVRVYGHSHGSHDDPHFQTLVDLEGALELEVDGRTAALTGAMRRRDGA